MIRDRYLLLALFLASVAGSVHASDLTALDLFEVQAGHRCRLSLEKHSAGSPQNYTTWSNPKVSITEGWSFEMTDSWKASDYHDFEAVLTRLIEGGICRPFRCAISPTTSAPLSHRVYVDSVFLYRYADEKGAAEKMRAFEAAKICAP